MTSTANRWLTHRQARTNARLRLFCLPYAGGGASAYYGWEKDLPGDIELYALQLPGREERYQEAPFTQVEPLIQTLGPLLQPYLDRPFALFGHSMGALIAFELARYWRREYQLLPAHLFVSAIRAPQSLYRDAPISQFTDEQFIEQVVGRYNAVPEAILNDREYMRLLLPTMRADFGMIETYAYQQEEPLACPIATFGGKADQAVPLRGLMAWKEQTKDDFSLRLFNGGHFFLREERGFLLELIKNLLQDS